MPIVIKYGGHAMIDPKLRSAVAAAIAALAGRGEQPVVVHGGGPFIRAALDDAGLPHGFKRGLRITSDESLTVIERVLTGLSKTLAQEVGLALGLHGRDARLLLAEPFDPELGRVGRMIEVDAAVLTRLLEAGLTPVLACLAVDVEGGALNVNADEVAGAVAGSLAAPVVFLTDVPGVLANPADPDSRLGTLTRSQAGRAIADGTIAGGMIPKVESALAALAKGAPYAFIADGRRADALEAALAGSLGTRLLEG